jgi:hypothetical protein
VLANKIWPTKNANRYKPLASLAGLAFFPHLLSNNHKSTQPCLTIVQKKPWKRNTAATSRSSRRAFTSQSPVEEASLQISFRISVKRLKLSCLFYLECNNIIYSIWFTFQTLSLIYFTHDIYHMCLNLILVHIWDASSSFLKSGMIEVVSELCWL